MFQHLNHSGRPLTSQFVLVTLLLGLTITQRFLIGSAFLGYENTLIHVYSIPSVWSFISCKKLFLLLIKLSLFLNHDCVYTLCIYSTYEMVPLWTCLFQMMLITECSLWECANFFNVQHYIGTLHKFFQLIVVAIGSCIPYSHELWGGLPLMVVSLFLCLSSSILVVRDLIR